mmetsp:Transcript_5622/g.7865  ORF Transcript_5622/g.7865 Transcript_5622/m.7865 type:complete len:301 (+) Transcript_5622:104-1006(+)
MAQPSHSQTKSIHFPRGTKEVLSGTFAGVAGTVVGHPLDLAKVRLQTQRHLYKGAIDCLFKVAKHEGIAGLYKGLAPPLVSLTFLNSLSFGAYSQFKQTLSQNSQQSHTLHHFLAGGLTGISAGIFSTPFEMVKVRAQLDNVTTKRFKGSFDCAKHLIKENGIKSLYLGYSVNTVREFAFCSVYFGIYEKAKVYLTQNVFHNPSYGIALAGGLSGMTAWFISFPLDCIKANIQGQHLPPGVSRSAKSSFSVAKELWMRNGIRAFYSGVGPSVARAFIVSSMRFSAYEFALWGLSSLEQPQ